MSRGSIIPRKNKKGKVYTVRYRVGKKQMCETVGSNKKQAERRLSEIMYELNNGSFTQLRKIDFKTFAQEWLENYASGRVKDSTFSTYSHTIRHHLNPVFGEFPLTYVSQPRISGFINQLSKTRNPKTVNNILIQMKTMFKHAKRWGYVRENPAVEIENLREEHKEMDYLQPHEISLLLKHSHEPYKTLFLTAVLTGMRRGELLSLQWGDIDWNSHSIFVRRNLYWTKEKIEGAYTAKWKFITPKSRRSFRTLVMSPKLKEALEIHRINSPVNEYDLVFANTAGKPMDPNNMVKRQYMPTLRFAGLRHVNFHSLRHSYTALLIAQETNIKFIQSQLGHASIQTTMDRYGHLLPITQEGVGERLDGQIFANHLPTEQARLAVNARQQEQNQVALTSSKL